MQWTRAVQRASSLQAIGRWLLALSED